MEKQEIIYMGVLAGAGCVAGIVYAKVIGPKVGDFVEKHMSEYHARKMEKQDQKAVNRLQKMVNRYGTEYLTEDVKERLRNAGVEF